MRNLLKQATGSLQIDLTAEGLAEILNFRGRHEVSNAHRVLGLRGKPRRHRNSRLRFGEHDVFVGSVIQMLRRFGADVALIRECADLCYDYEPGQRRWLCISHDGARLADRHTDADGLAIDLKKQYADITSTLVEIAKLNAQAKPETVAAN